MHVVIAWWDKHRATVRLRPPAADPTSFTGDFPGLRSGQWITDPAAELQGLALTWDSATSAELSLPALSERVFGCPPCHRWAFDLSDASPAPDAPRTLPAELELLLHA
ncbi:hypothetical protein [Streptomyces sp. AD55]|uniref:hypothetical protein n=1 Tax=Streptomyces sp. AD55 TaxID=3242895 RepID=UPI003529741B